jgi:hypothetical protein
MLVQVGTVNRTCLLSVSWRTWYETGFSIILKFARPFFRFTSNSP